MPHCIQAQERYTANIAVTALRLSAVTQTLHVYSSQFLPSNNYIYCYLKVIQFPRKKESVAANRAGGSSVENLFFENSSQVPKHSVM